MSYKASQGVRGYHSDYKILVLLLLRISPSSSMFIYYNSINFVHYQLKLLLYNCMHVASSYYELLVTHRMIMWLGCMHVVAIKGC